MFYFRTKDFKTGNRFSPERHCKIKEYRRIRFLIIFFSFTGNENVLYFLNSENDNDRTKF